MRLKFQWPNFLQKNEETLPRGEPQQSGIGQYGDNMGGLSEKTVQKRLTMPKLEQYAKQSVCLTPKFDRKNESKNSVD